MNFMITIILCNSNLCTANGYMGAWMECRSMGTQEWASFFSSGSADSYYLKYEFIYYLIFDS